MNRRTFESALTDAGVGRILLNESMTRHTTWRIGGPADYFVLPSTVEELSRAVRLAGQFGVPWTVIGRGSNLLVQDGGLRGLVIKLHDQFSEVSVSGSRLTALAGRSIVSLAGLAVRDSLGGLEFATGIPGSVGGAVMMNAGAHGSEISRVLDWADVMDGSGEVRRWMSSDLAFAYRYSRLKDEPGIVVRAQFQLEPADKQDMANQIKAWSRRRAATQPLSLPNCGSVFRNPANAHAAELIEMAGLKGLCCGDAQISDKHANFVVNRGAARASDVLWLIHHAQEVVRERFGLELETEVRIIGETEKGG
ncbi:MAG: UDP-N-acetylmuramate dehydrogenase [Alicyclobacillaceae bacterium]|nr:UDP-N-acetylmuramate dehydrogenase [Alicyclobacillaceae bacterium]MCY0897193.1 UDP-N-acetylmuramate dehydrogenase [Alicyclobacillaceae bacterium]